MKLRSMEEKISYRLFLMGFLGLIFTAALCIFVFHKAFTAQAWSGLERETDLVRAGYEQTGDPTQLSAFVTDNLRVTLISQDGSMYSARRYSPGCRCPCPTYRIFRSTSVPITNRGSGFPPTFRPLRCPIVKK